MVWTMRRMLSAVGTNEGIELLLNRLSKTENNVQFLGSLTKSLETHSVTSPRRECLRHRYSSGSVCNDVVSPSSTGIGRVRVPQLNTATRERYRAGGLIRGRRPFSCGLTTSSQKLPDW